MAVIGKIRERSTLVLIIIGGAIIAFVLGDLFGSGQSVFNQTRNVAMEYQKALENYQANKPEETIDDNLRDVIRQQVYDQMVRDILVRKQFEDLGIAVTTKELFDMVQGKNPHPQVRQAFTNPETGQFSPDDVVRFIQNLNDNPEVKSQWLGFEQGLRKEREFEKYNTLISKGLYVTNDMAAQKNAANKTMNIKYVLKRFNDVSDTSISITESELKDYYTSHQDDYKQEASKKIEYVVYPIAASELDIELVDRWANQMYKEFSATKNDSLFITNNSDERFDGKYYTKTSIPAFTDTALFEKEVGFVTPPFRIQQQYAIQKVLDKKVGADSAKVRHIIISIQNKTLEQANAIVDSLEMKLAAGADFATIAIESSEDPTSGEKGGDLGWFNEGVLSKKLDQVAFNAEFTRLLTAINGIMYRKYVPKLD